MDPALNDIDLDIDINNMTLPDTNGNDFTVPDIDLDNLLLTGDDMVLEGLSGGNIDNLDDTLNAVFDDLPLPDGASDLSLPPSNGASAVNSVLPSTVGTPGESGVQMKRKPSALSLQSTIKTQKPKKLKPPTKKELKAAAVAAGASGTATPAGFATPSGLGSVSTTSLTGLATPQTSTFRAMPQPPQQTLPQPPKEKGEDPDKLSDAVFAAGIDLKAEESLLLIANQNKINTMTTLGGMTPQKLLDLKQCGGFMNRVIRANSLRQLDVSRVEIVELMLLACDDFMKDIITNSVVYSRHRRRPIKSKVKSSSTQRSEISRALRDLAVKEKEAEEKRMKKRIALGMDSGDDKGEKAGVEESLHRAANATAAMMMAGPKKKKYSWMTGSSNSSSGAPDETSGSSNAAVALRGDTGIRYREAREEPGIVLRDVVAALESKRIGVDRTLTKAYSKL